MTTKLSGIEIEKIIETYFETDSIIETAKICEVSTVKVRKILITAQLWSSKTSDAIADLLEQGKTTAEIADELCMSVKNVQAYMPYERGAYGGDERSLEAIRSSKYRQRMKAAADMQVTNKHQIATAERVEEVIEKNTALRNDLGVIKLHIELKLDEQFLEEIATLKEYGSMKESISRDILVPSDISLHALHYAIMRMFGWQNSHLHNFHLPEDVTAELTDNKFINWAKLAGVYFRFPTENYHDIYWDDDYKEGQSVKSWLRKKYTGPYKYKGLGEHYLCNQMEVSDMFRRWPLITVREFCFGADIQPAPYDVKLVNATLKEIDNTFMEFCNRELVERLPLAQVLRVKGGDIVDLEALRLELEEQLFDIDLDEAEDYYEMAYFSSEKKHQEFLSSLDVPVKPVTDVLLYDYDYGDGWEIAITADAEYHRAEDGAWSNVYGDALDVSVDDLNDAIGKHRPICIAKDGIELLDDVGGIGGFCEMLEVLNGDTQGDPELIEAQDDMRAWASMLGWTGRKISPKQTL